MSIYTDEGYKGRRDYVYSLAEEYEIPADVVVMIAQTLGQSEDFDGLVTWCQDHEGLMYEAPYSDEARGLDAQTVAELGA